MQKANRDFDLLIVTDAGHQRSIRDPPRCDYFVRNLLGAEPPSNYEMTPP